MSEPEYSGAPHEEDFEGNPDFEDAHYGIGAFKNMGHGDTCNHCNDAIINDYESEMPGRSNKSFQFGSKNHGATWIHPKKDGGEMEGPDR
jgi:hypothetical protein